MNRKALYSFLALVLLLGAACHSLNQITPKGADNKAIETEVRSRIAGAVPEKTFAVQVDVHEGVVTLGGYAKTTEDRTKISNAAGAVEGVKSVIDNIEVKP